MPMRSGCPQCQLPMRPLMFNKEIDELYCERCDISIDRKDQEHRGNKEYGDPEKKWEEIRNG